MPNSLKPETWKRCVESLIPKRQLAPSGRELLIPELGRALTPRERYHVRKMRDEGHNIEKIMNFILKLEKIAPMQGREKYLPELNRPLSNREKYYIKKLRKHGYPEDKIKIMVLKLIKVKNENNEISI